VATQQRRLSGDHHAHCIGAKNIDPTVMRERERELDNYNFLLRIYVAIIMFACQIKFNMFVQV